jgi:hypothetical protein
MTARLQIPMRTAAALALAALTLAGCATSDSDDSAARFLVAPGKFRLYNCEHIKIETARVVTRQRELEALMARSAAGSGGEFVNAVAYRPEYLSLRGEMIDLQRTAQEKKCDFVPGQAPAPRVTRGRASR